MNTLLQYLSDRSKMVVFITRKDAGRRGATALEPGDLLKAIINEDQGNLAKLFEGAITHAGLIRAPEPFFSAEAASKILLGLHDLLPEHDPIPESVDITISPSLQQILNAARTLARELHQSQVQPLHFVAAILAEEGGGPGEILKEAGISREVVIQALRS